MGYKTTDLDFTLAGNYRKIGYFFDSLADVNKFLEDVFKSIPIGTNAYTLTNRFVNNSAKKRFVNSKSNKATFFGVNNDSFVDTPIDRYLNIDRVQNEVSKLSNTISKKKFVDIDQIKRIEFTDKEVGVFSFDMASLGLVKVYEYYSPLLNRIVSANFVKSEKTGSGEIIFYFQGTPFVPKHEIQYVGDKGGYYSQILKRVVDKDELIQEEGQDKIVVLYYPEKEKIEKHEVERKQKVGADGKKKFASTFKKCFIEIKKVKKQLPRVDIIVPIGYAGNITSDQAFWNAIQVLSICEKLTRSGVIYRVIGSIATETINEENKIYKFINLKNENQPLDPNQISIIVSDMRYYRLNGFLLKQLSQYDSGLESAMDVGISYAITDLNEIKDAYINFLSKQTSQNDINASQFPDSKIVLNYALSEQAALDGYNNTIQLIERL
jgi:hypothetical protein